MGAGGRFGAVLREADGEVASLIEGAGDVDLGEEALLVQVIGVVLEAGYAGDLANNAPGLLLLVVLFLNCLG